MASTADVFEVRGIRVDLSTRCAWRHGEPLVLTRKEFALLHALISRAGRVVGRELLMLEVWETTFYVTSKTIDVHIGLLRRKLGDDPLSPHLITTWRGAGYRFEPDPHDGRRP